MSIGLIGSAIEEYQTLLATDKVKIGGLAGDALRSINIGYALADARRNMSLLTQPQNPRVTQLEEEISNLRKQIQEQAKTIHSETEGKEKLSQENDLLNESLSQLQQKEALAFLLSRVSPEAHDALLTDSNFRQQFFSSEDCDAFVVSVDIRRSTELMLKARKPQLFAKFISELCTDLEQIIKNARGVFDKFTGDGILAFFPKFYSGPDAGLLALRASQQCQDIFVERYKQHRSSFSTVLNDVGLGIGVDYGPVHLLRVAGGITVVGSPVVYACRLSSAPAGHIYVNQPAFEVMFEKHGSHCYAAETSLDIKHEGNVLCYDVSLGKTACSVEESDWQKIDPSQDNKSCQS